MRTQPMTIQLSPEIKKAIPDLARVHGLTNGEFVEAAILSFETTISKRSPK
jgi:hypothetical protein